MRKAIRIELHDVPIVLEVESNEIPGWGGTTGTHILSIYELRGNSVYNFIFHFFSSFFKSFPNKLSTDGIYPFLHKVVPIAGSRYSDGFSITELWAQPKTSNLLEIKLVKDYHLNDASQTYNETHQITYSGNYTIWWATNPRE